MMLRLMKTQSVDQGEHCDLEQYTDPDDSSFELPISGMGGGGGGV